LCLLGILGLQIWNLVSYISTTVYGAPDYLPRSLGHINFITSLRTKINLVSSFFCRLLGLSLPYSRISRNIRPVIVSPGWRALSSLQWLQYSKKLKTTWLLLHVDMSTGQFAQNLLSSSQGKLAVNPPNGLRNFQDTTVVL